MCGVVGIAGKSPVNQLLYDALTMLQHRGQDAAGIITCHDGRLYLRKDNGMVRDVFHTRHMRALVGHYGIGHVRYPTAGSSSSAEAQPFYVNSPYGISLAHNGNLPMLMKFIKIYSIRICVISIRIQIQKFYSMFLPMKCKNVARYHRLNRMFLMR